MARERMAEFDRFVLFMTLEQACAASHQGDCQEDAEALAREIAEQLDRIGPLLVRDELRGYGAWDDDELSDDERNRVRIVWLAAGNITEHMRETRGRRFSQGRVWG